LVRNRVFRERPGLFLRTDGFNQRAIGVNDIALEGRLLLLIGPHPLRQLYDAGVKVTVSSDDPPLFGTTIDQEYALLESVYGFTPEEIADVTLAGVDAAFLPAGEKAVLRVEVIAGSRALNVDVT
jgi:hypothetical protein